MLYKAKSQRLSDEELGSLLSLDTEQVATLWSRNPPITSLNALARATGYVDKTLRDDFKSAPVEDERAGSATASTERPRGYTRVFPGQEEKKKMIIVKYETYLARRRDNNDE